MSGISQLYATALPLIKPNVDTDQLLPKQFLTSITRRGYGKHLFHDWRYIDPEGKQENPDFVLNQSKYKGAEILLAGINFGCGSSREHAPWALADFGFKVIIAPSFADIFYSNCINNLILPIVLSESIIKYVADLVTLKPSSKIAIDLPNQTVTVGEHSEIFLIENHYKINLLSGLDSIAQSLLQKQDIEDYENCIPQWRK
tara:strand:+ start:13950 stop:14552 length:603 start_codon:yes stop_codon:yes gene_type:complete